jgi:plastocyanin
VKILGLTTALLAIATLAPLGAAADALQHDVVVNVDDVGFTPPVVSIPVGGSVTWIEKGLNVHTANSLAGAPQLFSTGGFGPFQSVSLTFNTAGTYPYTSATDCLNGNNIPRFVCAVYYVLVVPPGGSVPQVPAPILPASTPAPAAAASAPAATTTSILTISDGGFSRASITIPAGSAVLWVNAGSLVHTATSTRSVPVAFDSGGLGPNQSAEVTFTIPGTYIYTSAPDSLNGGAVPGFNCGPYSVIVSGP